MPLDLEETNEASHPEIHIPGDGSFGVSSSSSSHIPGNADKSFPNRKGFFASSNVGMRNGRMISSRKLYPTPKSIESDLKPTILFLRDISRHAHQMVSWYEIPEKFTLLQLLHDLGRAVLSVNRQDLDNEQNEGYSLLCHEIERSRSTINGFFNKYRNMYQALDVHGSSKRGQWAGWVEEEVSKLKLELLPQIESVRLLTLVDQM